MTNKIFITGNACSGTTLFIRLLGEMGLEMGWNPVKLDVTFKGLEFLSQAPMRGILRSEVDFSPYVIKQPIYYNKRDRPRAFLEFDVCAEKFGWRLEHVFITKRDPVRTAESTNRQLKEGGRRPPEPMDELVEKLTAGPDTIIKEIERRQVPYTVVEYPRYAFDVNYLAESIKCLDIPLPKIKEAFKIIDPERLS